MKKKQLLAIWAFATVIFLGLAAVVIYINYPELFRKPVTAIPAVQPGSLKQSIPATGAGTAAVERRCTTLGSDLPEGTGLSGTLALVNPATFTSTAYDLADGRYKTSPIPYQYAHNYNQKVFTSPDGKWAAYLAIEIDETGYREKSRILHVVDTSGRQVNLTAWQVDWQYLIGWVDGQHLAISTPDSPKGGITVLIPFTKEFRQVKEGVKSYVNPETYRLPDSAYFNPEMSLAVYPSSDCQGKCSKTAWSLADLARNTAPWYQDNAFGALPKWSPDGRKIAIFGDFQERGGGNTQANLLTVDANGNAIPVTGQISAPADLRNSFAWSPESERIVAWLGTTASDAEAGADLALIDVLNQRTYNLCLHSDQPKRGYQAPVWSPDGQYFAVAVYDQAAGSMRTVIVDAAQLRAYPLGADLIPLGWMANP
jgi:hypothetical protein